MDDLQTANKKMQNAFALYRAKRLMWELDRINDYTEVRQAWTDFQFYANAYQLERRANGLPYILVANT